MSIRHTVMWKLKNPADAPRFKALLDGCVGLVPGMQQFEVAVRCDGLEANCDVVLLSTFDDPASLAAYQSHPHHVAVAAQLGPLRESRCVLDHPVPDPGGPA
jgi:quinol monooxygenase YgiN